VLVADEIEHGQAGLAFGPTQAPAQLLKDLSPFGLMQEQHGIELNVHAFVEQIDREHHVDFSVSAGEGRRCELRAPWPVTATALIPASLKCGHPLA
jgi:hypothetical protein